MTIQDVAAWIIVIVAAGFCGYFGMYFLIAGVFAIYDFASDLTERLLLKVRRWRAGGVR